MKEPDPILITDDNGIPIAQYDPTLNAGYDETGKYVRAIDREGSYQHTMQELDLARLEGRITPTQFREYKGWMDNARKNYQASLKDYSERETALEVGLGDIINESSLEEQMLEAMNDAKEISLDDLNRVRGLQKVTKTLRILKKQSGKLERIASNLNMGAA